MSEKKLHLALGVSDLAASIADYSRRLGAKPVVVVDGEYALWRTKTLNVSIRQAEGATGLRHLGWEDSDAGEFSSESDCNGLVWEHFSAAQQAEEINRLWPQADYQLDARHRRIKSFVLRQGHLSKGQEKALYDFGPRFCIPYAAEPLDLDAAFGRQAPRVLEIGFGMGQATAEIAAGRADTDFIGVEVHTPGVGSLLKLVGEGNIGNVRIIQHDAVEVLQHMLAPYALDGVHIYFPDPWHKKRHHKRRLIQPEFVQLLLGRLKPGGYIHLATDWEDYAIQMLDVLSATPQLENTADGYAQRPDYRPLTKFENRGIRLGHGVWDLVFRKK